MVLIVLSKGAGCVLLASAKLTSPCCCCCCNGGCNVAIALPAACALNGTTSTRLPLAVSCLLVLLDLLFLPVLLRVCVLGMLLLVVVVAAPFC